MTYISFFLIALLDHLKIFNDLNYYLNRQSVLIRVIVAKTICAIRSKNSYNAQKNLDIKNGIMSQRSPLTKKNINPQKPNLLNHFINLLLKLFCNYFICLKFRCHW